MRVRSATVFLLFLAIPDIARAQQLAPASLPAHDAHEGLLVAADPYQDAARYKARFGKKNPYAEGILAVEVFLHNHNDLPIRLNLESIRLLVRPPGLERQRLEPLAVEDVVDRILDKDRPRGSVPRRRVPIPGRAPSSGRGKDWEELASVLRSVALETDILPPKSVLKGFLFFDLNRHFDWVAHARLYLPDLRWLTTNQPLLFFEVDLAPAAPR